MMSERDHYLHGADDVRSAANTMSSAADAMRSAAGSMLDAVHALRDVNYNHETFMSQWLDRFEAAVEKMPKTEMQLRRELADANNKALYGATYDPRIAKPPEGGFDVT